MRRTSIRFVVVMTTLTLSLLWSTSEHRAAAPPGPYVVTDLGTLGGESARAHDLNDAGHVVGYATNAASRARAFLAGDGVMADLGTLGGPSSAANAVNAGGQVVGSASFDQSGRTHAVLWADGATLDLTPADAHGVAHGINTLGQIVGTRNHSKAFIWDAGVAVDLPHLGGGGGFAADINDAGQVVGTSYTTIVTELGPAPHAVLWQDGAAIDLGVLPGEEESSATAINGAGQVVGSSGRVDPETYAVASRSFLYANGVRIPLPVPSVQSTALDLNDHGVIVGTMRAAGGRSRHHAYVFADGVVTNLNGLIPVAGAFHLEYAYGINNAGQIAGVALDAQNRLRAVLLTPAATATSGTTALRP